MATNADSFAIKVNVYPAWKLYPFPADAAVPLLQLFAIKEPKSHPNACEFAESLSTVEGMSAASDAALVNGKQPNDSQAAARPGR